MASRPSCGPSCPTASDPGLRPRGRQATDDGTRRRHTATSTLNGFELYTVEGTGPGLVLVHGSWGDADNWAQVVPPLAAAGCTVVTYDRRGHSRSGRPASPPSVHDDVADLAALIEALDLAPAYVCGNSYGALITLRLAAARPDLVRGIAVHEPPGVQLLADDPATEPVARGYAQRLAPVRSLLEAGDHPGAAEQFVDTIALGPGSWGQLPDRVRRTFVRNAPTYLDELHDPDALVVDLPALRRYTKPLLLTKGDHSPPMFALITDRIAAEVPHAERHV